MIDIEKYLESQRALDKNGKPDESLFGVKIYKSFKAENYNQIYLGSTGYYRADGGTTILMGEILLYFRSTEDEYKIVAFCFLFS